MSLTAIHSFESARTKLLCSRPIRMREIDNMSTKGARKFYVFRAIRYCILYSGTERL